MSWLNKMTLLTHFFYWWKGYVFVVPKIIFFGCTSRYLVYRYVVAQLCGCRIVQLDLVAKSLPFSISLNNCYYELLCIHSPSLPFFFLIINAIFGGFFIRITRWTKIRLSEDLSLKQAYHNAVNYDSIVQFQWKHLFIFIFIIFIFFFIFKYDGTFFLYLFFFLLFNGFNLIQSNNSGNRWNS